MSEATLKLWRGFVSLILSAYFEKRMAWFPVDRLQMEVSAMTGGVCKPSCRVGELMEKVVRLCQVLSGAN